MYTSLRRKTQEKKVQVPGYHRKQGVGWPWRVESRKEQYFPTLRQALRFPSSGSVLTAAIAALPAIARNCPSKWCVGPFKMSVYPLNLSVFEHRSNGLPWTLYLIFRIPLRLWGFWIAERLFLNKDCGAGWRVTWTTGSQLAAYLYQDSYLYDVWWEPMIRHRGVARHVRSKGTAIDHMGVRGTLCCILTDDVTRKIIWIKRTAIWHDGLI